MVKQRHVPFQPFLTSLESRSLGRSLETSHTRTASLRPTAASALPSGLNATPLTPEPNVMKPSSRGASLSKFQSVIFPSSPPAASRLPSEENATEFTTEVTGAARATIFEGNLDLPA